MIHYHIHKQGFWIRLGAWSERSIGKGICVSWSEPLFSFRNGYKKHWRIGPVRIYFLEKITYKD